MAERLGSVRVRKEPGLEKFGYQRREGGACMGSALFFIPMRKSATDGRDGRIVQIDGPGSSATEGSHSNVGSVEGHC